MHMTTTSKGYRLGRRPGEKGPRPQSSNRDWVEKLATGKDKRFRIGKEEITVGTYNVRTLSAAGRLQLLREEMKAYRCDILGLSEMRWTGAGELNGGEVIWSGEEKEHYRGVGFLLSEKAKAALAGYKSVNSRIIVARFNGQPLDISVIQAYAPTADSSEQEIDVFYEKLEQTLKELPKKDVKILLGDWNAKIGKDNDGWEAIMHQHGYGERNERGELLLEFALKHEMFICNTKFRQKDCRKWTWMAPDGIHTNMIDLIMIDRRWKTSVRLCRTFQGADMSSDHSLVLCNIQLRLKRAPQRSHRKQRNREALANETIRQEYKKEVSRQIRGYSTNYASIDAKVLALNEIVTSSVETVLPLTVQPKRKWITDKTLQLAQQKRSARLQIMESKGKQKTRLQIKQAEEVATKYKKLCNEVRTSARKDKQVWLDKQCSNIDQCMEQNRTKESYKIAKQISRKWQPKQNAIKDKQGKILMDKEETKARWTEYCSELYCSTGRDNKDLLSELEKISPPPKDDENDNILYEEVEAAVKYLKKNKSPGADGVWGEALQAGGKELWGKIHELCMQIWREKRIPEEWTKSVLVTIPKKGDLTDCKNYRTIALISHMAKILLVVLLNRLKAQMEEYLTDEQAGFRKDRNTVQQILMLRLIAEKAKRKNKMVYNCFIDFQKAFDSIEQDVTWATLKSYGVGKRLIEILQNIGERSKSAVKVGQEIGEWFPVTIGTRQGDPLSPITFITYLERVMDCIQDNGTGISVQGETINNLKFADDIDLIEESWDALEKNITTLNQAGEKAGLRINIEKTETMVFGKEEIDKAVEIDSKRIKNVKEFVYLGSLLTWDNDCSKDIRARIGKAKGAMAGLNKIWKSKQITFLTKMKLLKSCVFSTALYACETWTYKKKDISMILAFEMYCYRWILHLNWTQKVTNVEVRKRLHVTEDLMQAAIRRKLNMFGHICRMNNERKMRSVMMGIMDGTGKRGRPDREWLDDIRDWCQKDIHFLITIAHDRVKWKAMVKCAVNTYGLSAHGL